MKKLLTILTLLICAVLLFTSCDDGSVDGISGGGGGPCTHSWVVDRAPVENNSGSASCSTCGETTQIPALSEISLYTIEAAANSMTKYTFTMEDGQKISFTHENFIFEKYKAGYALIGYRGIETEITVPSTYKELPVVAVRCSAIGPVFKGGEITSITIPASVTEIQSNVIANCTGLKTLTLPAADDGSGNNNTTSPAEILGSTVPQTLETVTINAGTTISSYHFKHCPGLKTVYLPSTITSIGYESFGDCPALESVYFGGTLEDWCKIEFNDSLSSHPLASADTLYLKNESGEWYTVGETLVIPNTVTKINDQAFYKFGMKTLIIPDTVTSLGIESFCECPNLETVVIGSTVSSIGKNAFYQCESLTTTYYKGNASGWGRIAIDNSDGPSNYFLFESEKYYYSEEGDVFEFAKGNDLWHFGEDGLPTLWTFTLTNYLDGKSFTYLSTRITLSDEYWQMLEAAKAQGMLDYIFDTEADKQAYLTSATKQEYATKLENKAASEALGLTVSFSDGKLILSQGANTAPSKDYIEYDGKVYLTYNESVAYTIDAESGFLIEDVSNEYNTIEHVYLLNTAD